MSDTQRQGIITLIYKKGDIESLNNWRPITLLNYDYKIMAAALANRLHKVISSIIHENQVGYVKKRMSGFNIRLTQDIFEYMHRKKKKGAVMTIDFRQAFDTIEFEFIEECLNNFNFGGDFCNWIKLMYTDVNSSVLINGWKTKTFEIGRGIRQGCPLSAMLFILAVEVLADRIRKNDRIKGVIFGEIEKQKELKVLQYADDTSVFFREELSLHYIMNEIDEFGRVAGPVINKNKTSLKWLGPMKQTWNFDEFGLKWEEGCIKYLGCYIGTDLELVAKLNWETKLEKIRRVVDNWRRRNLTLIGRVIIIKTLLISQIINLIMFCSVPQSVMKKLDKIIYEYLWGSKVNKVRKDTVVREYVQGGIKMIDIEKLIQSFRLKWMGRIIDETDGYWKDMAMLYFEQFGGLKLLLNCSVDSNMIAKYFAGKIPNFYLEILKAWFQFKKSDNQNDIYSDNQILWYNKYITVENKPFFFFFFFTGIGFEVILYI